MGTTELLDKIRAEGQGRVSEIEADRDQKVKEIAERQSAEVAELGREWQERTERETRLVAERARSRSRIDRRKALLGAKWEVIGRVFDKARERVLADGRYGTLVSQIAAKHAGKDGVVRMSPADTARFGRTLEARVGDPVAIDGGLIIETGRQVLDFSLKEWLAAIREELASELAGLIFPGSEETGRARPGS
ncbi:MAG: V-type ATP synthase subunit E [candidate division WOR-3 bacterium]|nr:MAG: V-type ATP synthase subunit E [candidate division WOR-3 bacterium]